MSLASKLKKINDAKRKNGVQFRNRGEYKLSFEKMTTRERGSLRFFTLFFKVEDSEGAYAHRPGQYVRHCLKHPKVTRKFLDGIGLTDASRLEGYLKDKYVYARIEGKSTKYNVTTYVKHFSLAPFKGQVWGAIPDKKDMKLLGDMSVPHFNYSCWQLRGAVDRNVLVYVEHKDPHHVELVPRTDYLFNSETGTIRFVTGKYKDKRTYFTHDYEVCGATIKHPHDDTLHRCSLPKGHEREFHQSNDGLNSYCWFDIEKCEAVHSEYGKCNEPKGHSGCHANVEGVWPAINAQQVDPGVRKKLTTHWDEAPEEVVRDALEHKRLGTVLSVDEGGLVAEVMCGTGHEKVQGAEHMVNETANEDLKEAEKLDLDGLKVDVNWTRTYQDIWDYWNRMLALYAGTNEEDEDMEENKHGEVTYNCPRCNQNSVKPEQWAVVNGCCVACAVRCSEARKAKEREVRDVVKQDRKIVRRYKLVTGAKWVAGKLVGGAITAVGMAGVALGAYRLVKTFFPF